jgi:hypothetical protein
MAVNSVLDPAEFLQNSYDFEDDNGKMWVDRNF